MCSKHTTAGGSQADNSQAVSDQADTAAAQQAEDEHDTNIARQRLADIESNPDALIRGSDLEHRMREWLRLPAHCVPLQLARLLDCLRQWHCVHYRRTCTATITYRRTSYATGQRDLT